MFCLGISCELIPCQSLAVQTGARLAVARKYEINESLFNALAVTCCCPCCGHHQLVSEVAVQERMAMGCCGLGAAQT